MASRVVNPAPSVVDPTRPRGVQPLEVPVRPRQTGEDRDGEAAHCQEPGGDEEEDGANGDPEGAGDEDQRREEDQPQNHGGDRHAGEQKKNAAGDDEGHDSNELGGAWCMFMEST